MEGEEDIGALVACWVLLKYVGQGPQGRVDLLRGREIRELLGFDKGWRPKEVESFDLGDRMG